MLFAITVLSTKFCDSIVVASNFQPFGNLVAPSLLGHDVEDVCLFLFLFVVFYFSVM